MLQASGRALYVIRVVHRVPVSTGKSLTLILSYWTDMREVQLPFGP